MVSVGCYLPLSDNPSLPRNYGSRHRGAIGISERCDAISLIVSEERGEVLLAVGGEVAPKTYPEDLQRQLESMLLKPERPKGRWQAALTANLVPKVVSFIVVVVLWGLIAGQQRAEMLLTVPLEYRNMPANMEIAGDLLNRVEVGVRGPRGMISHISPDQIRAYVDLSQATRGLNNIRLTPENIQAPLGSEITKLSPSSVRVWMENVKTRTVPVKAQLVGKLPKTLRLITIWVEPPFVVLQGPESALAKVREISTEAVDLSSIRENKKVTVGLDIESPQIHLGPGQPSQVTVDIRVERAT